MTHRILVLGGGYAGVTAARRAAGLLRAHDATVTLVNAEEHFVERVRLHQVATGQVLRQRSLRALLAGSGVELVVARATALDPAGRTVSFDAGSTSGPHVLDYDTLVVALGSVADTGGVPGVARHAFAVAEPAGARACADRLGGLTEGRVTVVGAGLTGLETAAELVETHPGLRIELVTSGGLGDGLSRRGARHLRRALAARGIDVVEGAAVSEVGSGAICVDGRERPADAVVWAAGFRAPALLREAGLEVDGRGRMVVDATLRAPDHPEIHGAGDAVAAPARGGTTARMSCQAGLPMGWHAGGSVARELAGREPAPADVRFVWQNLGLGRRDALLQVTRADDTPVEHIVTGRAAAAVKEVVTRSAAFAACRPGARTAVSA